MLDLGHLPRAELERFCRRWNVSQLALFGSALRDDFRPDSDIDLLVSFREGADWSLLDHLKMQDELKGILGREVDLVSRRALERSENDLRRDEIIRSARVLYAA